MMRFKQRAETQSRTGFTIDFTFYKVLIIILMPFNVYGRFVLYFHLHYQVIPKIACMFSKPYEVKTSLLHYYRIGIFLKETSKSNVTVSNNSVNIGHCI